MSSESSVHSNALNFMSFMESGVDSRTGQYTLSIKLPDLGANFFQGPNFDLALNFNPLNTIDSGWGRGWDLQLTQYTAHNNMLTTFTGESFKVSGSQDGRLHMPEQKLAHFHLYPEPAGPGGALRYRVVHRSGLVEILEMMGSQKGQIALPVQVYSPQGHALSLSYTQFNPAYVMLASIRDGSGQLLLEVERRDDQVEFRERPYQGPGGEPVARYVMVLQGADRRVTSIVLPSPEQANWRFVYREVLGHVCLERVTTPTGAREYLQYRDGGHPFPGNSRAPLPRVTRHTVEPGLGQEAFHTNYSYPRGNFLGHGTAIPWRDDGFDNLYQHTGDYVYQTVESLCDINDRELQSITRTFNRFHLPVMVRTAQNGSIREVMTTYELADNLPFAQQVATLQLPINEQTRWSNDGHTPPSRLEPALETRYDTHGNTVWRKQPNGVIERSSWFGPQAEAGFPGDPLGFRRHLKSRTVTPSADGAGSAPELVQAHTYRQLPPLAGHASRLEPWLAEHSQTLSHQGEILERTLNRYVDAPANRLLHGRRYQQVRTLGKLQTTTQYHFKTLTDELSGHPVLETTTDLLGYDDTQRSRVERRSLLLGETVFERDENGVHTQREHDALRRVTREWVSPGTEYAASRHYTYALCANDGDIAWHRVKNARGVTTHTELDGLGRVARESRDNIHSQRPDGFFELLAVAYDALGNRVSETHTDWLNDSRLLTLTTAYRYDDWGEQCCVIGPDGVEEHDALDPIGTSFHEGPVRRSWREGGTLEVRTSATTLGGKNTPVRHRARAKSANRETWLNLFEKPVKIRRLNALGDPLAERTYQYDGLGRTLTETDERRHTTTFSYDPWGRMLSTLLPEGTRLSRSYAEHSSEELPASLLVTPANVNQPAREVGTQHHDGLDRLIGASSGNRVEYFLFDGGESQPRKHVTPAGVSIELDYNLQLTAEPTSLIAPGDPASYSYNALSARLESTANLQGTRSFDYNLSNQMIGEHWEEPGGKRWSTHHMSTVSDRLSSSETNGVTTDYVYDPQGRLQAKHQGQLQAHYQYDELGRLKRLTSTDLASATTLETHIEYDDQDHETKRTWRQAGLAERTLEQNWANDDLLQGRHLRQAGVTLLEESFMYDARARLARHECKGPELPVDALGRQVTRQDFSFDVYDNISSTITHFAGGPEAERARFNYAESDPCQLLGIVYTPSRSEPPPRFSYDANGNLTHDERGRQLHYDSQNRLLGIDHAANSYRYDAGGLLVASASGTSAQSLRLYEAGQLRMEVRNGLNTLYFHSDEQPLGQQQSGPGAQPPLLLHTSASHSVVAESLGTDLRSSRYSAYGEQHSEQPVRCVLGYNGEALDPDSGWYLLGNGYRAYNPVLMRFHSPDALSPFGAGGLNCYGYCQGNPVTFRDPTGHYSTGYSGTSRSLEELERNRISPTFQTGTLFWVGLAVGAVITVVTGGAAIKAAVALAAVTKGAAVPAIVMAVAKVAALVTSAVLGATGTIVQTEGVLSGNEERANLGTILGLAGAVVGLPTLVLGGASFLKTAGKGLNKILGRGSYTLTKFKPGRNLADPLSSFIDAPKLVAARNTNFSEFRTPSPKSHSFSTLAASLSAIRY